MRAISRAWVGLDLLAGGKELAGINRLIARESIRPELMLSRAPEAFEGQYDFVVLDTSPSFTELGVNCLFYAERAIVPVSIEPPDPPAGQGEACGDMHGRGRFPDPAFPIGDGDLLHVPLPNPILLRPRRSNISAHGLQLLRPRPGPCPG